MIIKGKELAQCIYAHLEEEVASNIKKGLPRPKLVIFSISPAEETISFLKSKRKAAEKIGADFELKTYMKTPRFEDFVNAVAKCAARTDVHGIVIQEPLPSAFSTVTLVDYIPLLKEIEGFKKKSPYNFPVGLAVLTALKSLCVPEESQCYETCLVKLPEDVQTFKNFIKRKKVVLMGRGKTGGEPIGKTLHKAKIGYVNLSSQTKSNASYFTDQADIIISAVGKEVVIRSEMKPNVILVSVGMRKEEGKWKGDYDENDIQDFAMAHTPTPGGIGPLTVAYLLHNLVDAWKAQYPELVKEGK